MTDLHARVDLLEGSLEAPLAGAAANAGKRAFVLLSLMRGDGTSGIGEASPLPGYSDDDLEHVLEELQRLVEAPLKADPLGAPFDIVSHVLEAAAPRSPSARFAIETALLDWLGHERGLPLHRILGGDAERKAVPIAALVLPPSPEAWPACVDALVAEGAGHVKLKVGADLASEVVALQAIREAHPSLRIRLDGNRRVPEGALRTHASALENLELELFEEPLAPEAWSRALELPLPWALDESLRDPELRAELLDSGKVRAVVLKPTVLGGLRASFALAEQAVDRGSEYLVSHTFDGPVARAATAELALALQTPLAAGLGEHPALSLWTPHRIAAIEGGRIVPHDVPGLGLRFDDEALDA